MLLCSRSLFLYDLNRLKSSVISLFEIQKKILIVIIIIIIRRFFLKIVAIS